MAITINEAPDSQQGSEGDQAGVELRYKVSGSADGEAVRNAVWDNAPVYYSGLIKKSVSADPIFVNEDTPARCIWAAAVQYGRRRETPETGDSSMAFEVAGETQHITHSLQTVRTYAAAGETVPAMSNAIGVNKDGVEGVDIKVPQYSWTETHYLDDDQVTMNFVNLLFSLYAHVNKYVFRQFSPGEVLFEGARGQSRDESEEGDWEIDFSFAARPNRDDIYVGSIGPITKRGWEYLWVFYEKGVDSTAGLLLPQPRAVYVEQVYRLGEYNALQLPPPLD